MTRASVNQFHYSGGAEIVLRPVYKVFPVEYRTLETAHRVLCPDGERRSVNKDIDSTNSDDLNRTSQRCVVYAQDARVRMPHHRVYGRVGCVMVRNEYTLAFVPVVTGKWADLVRPPNGGPSAFGDAGDLIVGFFVAPESYAH